MEKKGGKICWKIELKWKECGFEIENIFVVKCKFN